MESGLNKEHIVMVIETSDYLHRLEANQFNLFTQKLHNSISKTLNRFNGEIITHNDNMYVVSFDMVTNSILSALKLQSDFKYITPKFDKSIRNLKIGIAIQNDGTINDTTLLATRMCEVVKDQIVITSNLKRKYEKENSNIFINEDHIRTLKPSEELFLTNLMNHLEVVWNDIDFSLDDLKGLLSYSKSQIYRRILSLSGKPPSVFIKDYRLNQALQLIHKRRGSIGEIANRSGFRSATYFSKCFKDKFRILASKYAQQHVG